MDVNLDALTRQLAGLTGRFADLGAKLTEAAREMQDGGAPPADALVEALAAARAEFVELLAQVVATAETLGVAVPDSVESAKSLEPVLAAMSAAVEARRRRAAFDEIRSRILAIYDRVAGLLHEGDESFGPVVTLKSKAEEAKVAALALTDATTEQARALMEAAGPFADLLTMLEAPRRSTTRSSPPSRRAWRTRSAARSPSRWRAAGCSCRGRRRARPSPRRRRRSPSASPRRCARPSPSACRSRPSRRRSRRPRAASPRRPTRRPSGGWRRGPAGRDGRTRSPSPRRCERSSRNIPICCRCRSSRAPTSRRASSRTATRSSWSTSRSRAPAPSATR